jgi:hypothetical protein
MELRKNEEDGREMQRRMAASNAVSQLTEEGRRSPLPAPDVALPLSIHAFIFTIRNCWEWERAMEERGESFLVAE